MPKLLIGRWYTKHISWTFAVLFSMGLILTWCNLIAGVLAWFSIAALVVATFTAEYKLREEVQSYLLALGLRVRKAGEKAIVDLPYGILLYCEDQTIDWHNPYLAQLTNQECLIGEKLTDKFPQLHIEKKKDLSMELFVGERIIHVDIISEERVIYFTDITELRNLRKRYDEGRIAIGMIIVDNLEESAQGLNDQQRSGLLARVSGQITSWASEHGVLMKQISTDRHFMIMDVQTLHMLEQTRFIILDEVRETILDNKLPVTLSMGIAAGTNSIPELGLIAQSSLDIALGRGGDQVAVCIGQRLSFYGGRSDAVEKRTRVRARVIAHALRDFIKQSDIVFIMGHKNPDTDSIGSSIGVLNACRMLESEAYIVLEESNPSIEQLIGYLKKDETLWSRFISRAESIEMVTEKSLVVVCDTHKTSIVEEPHLLQSCRIVVIDHHRRSGEFINNAVLVYLEPYASSTAELVTELLQYINDRVYLSMLEATTLLAGITVDTKHFTLRTGSRTFDAASFLRRHGADPLLIQHILKENLDEYIQKAEVLQHVQMLYGNIALVVTEHGRKFSQLFIARVADTLLNMTDVLASFVISERNDGLIGISARSLGQMNVQVVMERMGGGGHLMNAATQMQGTIMEAEAELKRVLEEINIEKRLFG